MAGSPIIIRGGSNEQDASNTQVDIAENEATQTADAATSATETERHNESADKAGAKP